MSKTLDERVADQLMDGSNPSAADLRALVMDCRVKETQIAALKSQLAVAQKDRERLDWLDERPMFDYTRAGGTQRLLTLKDVDGSSEYFNGDTIREAIDAAMEAEKNG